MATLIEAVKRQALLTFAKNRSTVYFEENLSKLKLLASKLTSSDVVLDKALLLCNAVPNSNPKSSWTPKSRLAPVTYIEIFENQDITIGIFILRNGARLPLHDHPLMYGILKVIHGKVRIHSYSPLSRKDLTEEQASETRFVDKCGKDYSSYDGEISPMELFRQVCLFAVKEPEVVVDQFDDACILSPRRGNLHEIHTVDGPAAFVDILSPPYDSDIPGFGPRPCRYFREVSHSDENLVKKLIRIPSPSDYWSDTAPYTGPSCNTSDE